MAGNEKTVLRKFDLGVIVTIALAIISFAFWLGGLQRQVNQLEPERLKALFDVKLAEAISKSVVPRGTIIAWYSASGPVPNGWAICDGKLGSGTPDLGARFLRGTTDFGHVGQTGGRETHEHDVFGHGRPGGEGVGGKDDHSRELAKAGRASNLPPYTDVIYIMKL